MFDDDSRWGDARDRDDAPRELGSDARDRDAADPPSTGKEVTFRSISAWRGARSRLEEHDAELGGIVGDRLLSSLRERVAGAPPCSGIPDENATLHEIDDVAQSRV